MESRIGRPSLGVCLHLCQTKRQQEQQPRLLEAFKMMLEGISPEHRHKYGMILHTGDPANTRGLEGGTCL